MLHSYTCDPATELNGQVYLAYVNNIEADIILPIFKAHNMPTTAEEVDPNGWYPLQPLLEVLKEISEGDNATANMVAIGIKIAEFGLDPADLHQGNLGFVLEHWEEHMYSAIRNGDVGRITTEKVNDTFYKVTQQNLFHDDLCYGLAYGFARNYLPRGTSFRVSYEDYNNRIDRGDNDRTVICVEWDAS